MLITDILQELTLPQTRQDAGTVLKNAGYRQIGKGSFSRVWAKPGDPYVLKLFEPSDQAYLAFITLAQKIPNKHFPVFRGRPVSVTQDYMAVRVERLAPPSYRSENLIMQCADYLEALEANAHFKNYRPQTVDLVKSRNDYMKTSKIFKRSYPDLAQAIDLIYTHVTKGNPDMMNDIDVRNTGIRGNDLVFIDPVYSGGAKFNFGTRFENVEVMELFTAPVAVQQGQPGEYSFEVDGKQFDLIFDQSDNGENSYDVSLLRGRQGKQFNNPYASQADFARPPIAVYTTCISIISKFLQIKRPQSLSLYGYDSHQHTLYLKIAHYIENKIPDYKIVASDAMISLVHRNTNEGILRELFDQPVQVSPIIPEQNNYFKVDGVQFTVAFMPLQDGKSIEVLLHRDDGQGDPFSSRGDFGQAGLQVYSTFVSIIKKYLKYRQPPALTITGADLHQKRLYTRLAKYMVVPGYRLYIDPKDQAQTAQIVREGVEPTEDEIKAIRADQQIKKRPNVRNMLFTMTPEQPIRYAVK